MNVNCFHRVCLSASLAMVWAIVASAQTQPTAFDFGDAPDGPYPTTLKNNGARHGILPGFSLGQKVDAEIDGKPNSDATGDDGSPVGAVDDEDGVAFNGSFLPGLKTTMTVTIVGEGRLSVWFDFNSNGSWADAEDQVFADLVLGPGPHVLNVFVPASAKPGRTFARFRLSHQSKLSFAGLASDGEVEDYSVNIESAQLDFGDAPETETVGFPTTLARNGARHQIQTGFHLGKIEDGEPNGLPNASATGDDVSGGASDEDGVRFLSPLVPGTLAQVEVTTTVGGRLDAWVDFNRNSSWVDSGERIFTAQTLVAGVSLLSFAVPASSQYGTTFARFRLSHAGRLSFDGDGGAGEVEDYAVQIQKPARCDLSCSGTDFWLTFPGNYTPDPSNPVRPSLWVLGNAGTTVTVGIAGLGFSKTVVIPVSQCVNVELPKGADLGDANDKVQQKGIHVTASAPVGIHGLSKAQFTSDGYLGLPTEVLGTEYYVLAYRDEQLGIPELNGSEFAVVATEAGTTITVIPSVVTGTHNAGEPFKITLGEGDVYQLRTTPGAGSDLTGTRVLSDKPIAVFGGHACANVRSASSSFCDYLVEQMTPVSQWATEFFARRLSTRLKGDTFRVLAAYDNTVVSVNGAAVTTLAAGQFYETLRPTLALVATTQITATRPVLVAQYANSSDFDNTPKSDPFMTLVPGRLLFSPQQRFCVPESGFLTHHVNIIAPTSAVGTVKLDGLVVGGFSAVGASGFSAATATVTGGVHSMTSSLPIGVTVYGWNEYESYGWPACLFFGDITPPALSCPPPVTVTLGGGGNTSGVKLCQAPVPDFASKVTYTDNCPRSSGLVAVGGVPAQDPPAGTFVGPGVHEITCRVSDARGNIGYCTTTFTVIDPNPNPSALPELHCPSDLLVKCGDSNGAVVDYQAFATVGCQQVLLDGSPPRKSLFPVGLTVVTCTLPGSSPPIQCTFNIIVSCAQVVANLDQAKLMLEWEGGTTLQMADSPSGPWVNISSTGEIVTKNTSESKQKFFRVR